MLGRFPGAQQCLGSLKTPHVQPFSAQSCPPHPLHPALRALDKGRGVALPLGAPSSNPLPALLSWGPQT